VYFVYLDNGIGTVCTQEHADEKKSQEVNKIEIIFDSTPFSHGWETMEKDDPSYIDRISLISKDSDGDKDWYDLDGVFDS
jgi:hypothetical protein